jgi:hypothetical protein
MRRFMILNFLVLFLSSVVLFSCSSVSERPISQSDIPDLIGKWEGYYDAGDGFVKPVRMEILNNSLEGNITFHGTAPTGAGPVPIAFNGKIENGRLSLSWQRDRWINMKLRKDDRDIKLESNYQWSQYKGTFTLEKIK